MPVIEDLMAEAPCSTCQSDALSEFVAYREILNRPVCSRKGSDLDRSNFRAFKAVVGSSSFGHTYWNIALHPVGHGPPSGYSHRDFDVSRSGW